jgi:hypothetical protein|tara:strand:+ start:273 stop:512 length:240 start_codon:yes stop_codon:yes gene_type:complete
MLTELEQLEADLTEAVARARAEAMASVMARTRTDARANTPAKYWALDGTEATAKYWALDMTEVARIEAKINELKEKEND